MSVEVQKIKIDPSYNADGENRVETGPLQFNDDWPGIFIRGDVAYGYAAALHAYLNDPNPSENMRKINESIIENFARLLVSCDVHQRGLPEFPVKSDE